MKKNSNKVGDDAEKRICDISVVLLSIKAKKEKRKVNKRDEKKNIVTKWKDSR